MRASVTPLAVAVLLLAVCGCEPDDQARYQEPTAVAPSADDFVESCMAGNVSAVRAGLDAGVDPNVYYSDGNTNCMIQAAAGGNVEIIRALLEREADPDLKRASDGYTALMNAALQGNAGVAPALLEGGADPSIENNFGQDAAAVARLRNHNALAEEIASADESSDDPEPLASAAPEPEAEPYEFRSSAVEKMVAVYRGNHSCDRIKGRMDEAMRLYNFTISLRLREITNVPRVH